MNNITISAMEFRNSIFTIKQFCTYKKNNLEDLQKIIISFVNDESFKSTSLSIEKEKLKNFIINDIYTYVQILDKLENKCDLLLNIFEIDCRGLSLDLNILENNITLLKKTLESLDDLNYITNISCFNINNFLLTDLKEMVSNKIIKNEFLRDGLIKLYETLVFSVQEISEELTSNNLIARSIDLTKTTIDENKVDSLLQINFEDFYSMMNSTFGFDKTDCETLYKIFQHIYSTQKEENIVFFLQRLFGSVIYGSYNSLVNMLFILQIGYIDFLEYLINEVKIPPADAKRLYYNIKLQHSFGELSTNIDLYITYIVEPNNINFDKNDPECIKQFNDYINKQKTLANKNDFCHFMQTSAFLSADNDIFSANSDFGFDSEAGWYGDAIGFPGISPSLGEDDYLADLDAVNINAMLNDNETYAETMFRYYNLLKENKINRAEEFKKNVPNFWDEIRKTVPVEYRDLPIGEMIEHITNPVTYNFAKSVYNNSNILVEYRA